MVIHEDNRMRKEKDEFDQLSKTCHYIKDIVIQVGSCGCKNCKYHLQTYNSNAEYILMTDFTCLKETIK